MKHFLSQLKTYITENKIYLTFLYIYTAVMVGIMGRAQSDVPFSNMKNFFSNNGVVIIIFLVQFVMLSATFFKNAWNKQKNEDIEVVKYIINNIFICVFFSLISSLIIIIVFFTSIWLSGGNSLERLKNLRIFYFGIALYGLSFQSIMKMFIYSFSINMVIMAVSCMLGIKNLKWHYIFSGGMILFLITGILLKYKIAEVLSNFFEVYGSPYGLSMMLIGIAVGILLYNWIETKRFISEYANK